MALQNTLTIAAVITGQNDAEYPSQQTINTNAPPIGAAQLQAGDNQIVVPGGFTVGSVWIKPPPNSANNKKVRTIIGDTGSPVFTTSPIVYPVTAGGSFYINSAGQETVELIWCQ